MSFSSEDLKVLKSSGITSLLDLALTIPRSFDDLSESAKPSEGENTVFVKIEFVKRGANSMLIATANAPLWKTDIKIVIFNAKPWHFGAFKSKKSFYIHGKCNHTFDGWQFINPKIITKVGEIIPHYKKKLKDNLISKFILTYVNEKSLINEGLNHFEAKELLLLHSITHENALNLSHLNTDTRVINLLKFIEIFNYLKKLSKKKIYYKARAIKLIDISSWLNSLPFRPTNDQISAINDIRKDLELDVSARRVVMGDVGSGKTLVMLAAALSIYPSCSVLMAPTSILSNQIYDEAKKLLPNFMNIKLVKSGDKDINFNETNLAIGTHALLYHDLPSSPLVMVDEQHRFGSNQRLKIDELVKDGKLHAHYVQFSATPIPRTLSLIESELVSFSFLKQMPFKKTIHTILLQNSGFNEMIRHIKKEISKNHQAIIVYPLVETSQCAAYQSLKEGESFWKENFKNVFTTHGKDQEKEQIIENFKNSGDILLTTTVVEVGISLPRLSIIVVVGAERLGLATLHQLRGRVGRKGGEGWCYLYTKLKNPPARLNEFAKTTDGFKIAQLDLKNRKAGDLLGGAIQHGATFEFYNYEEDITKAAKKRLDELKNIMLPSQ